MKYFIIHSGCDLESKVMPLIKEWTVQFERLKFVILNGTKNTWEGDAIAKIRQSQKVIIIIGEKTSLSENVDKEIEFALKEGKTIYVYKLNDSYALNKKLSDCDIDMDQQTGKCDGEIILAQKKQKIILADKVRMTEMLREDNNEVWNELQSADYGNEKKMLEQYKLFVQTSEELVKRKQTVNSFYITLNSVLISAIITVMCAVNDLPSLWGTINFCFLITLFAGFVGIVVSCSWFSLLNSYADLNASKMEIIQCIEERMAFNLYRTEWEILSNKLENRRYKSFSKKEKVVAWLFIVLYCLVIVAGLILSFV